MADHFNWKLCQAGRPRDYTNLFISCSYLRCRICFLLLITWYTKQWWVQTSRAKPNTRSHPKETALLYHRQWRRHLPSIGAEISASFRVLISFAPCQELQELLAEPSLHFAALGCRPERSWFLGWDFWAICHLEIVSVWLLQQQS